MVPSAPPRARKRPPGDRSVTGSPECGGGKDPVMMYSFLTLKTLSCFIITHKTPSGNRDRYTPSGSGSWQPETSRRMRMPGRGQPLALAGRWLPLARQPLSSAALLSLRSRIAAVATGPTRDLGLARWKHGNVLLTARQQVGR